MIEIEHLLRHRYRSEPISDAEHQENETLARVVAGIDDPNLRASATDLTVKNREWAEAVLLVSGGAALHGRSRAKRRSLILLGGAIAALVLVTLPNIYTATFQERSELMPKGIEDRLDVAAQRGANRIRLQPHSEIRAGDNLGFFYSARNPGFLTVVSIDLEGALSILQPTTAIAAGRNVSLRDGAVAGEGSGCEWIIAIFSGEPIAIEEMKKQIEGAPRAADGCKLSPTISGARSVQVIPLVR